MQSFYSLRSALVIAAIFIFSAACLCGQKASNREHTGSTSDAAILETTIAWWKCNDGSGSVVHDFAGTNHGLLSGGATWGISGVALNGGAQSVVFGDEPFRMNSGVWEATIYVQNFDNGWSYGSILEKEGLNYGNDGRLLVDPHGHIYWGIDDSASQTEVYILSPDSIQLNTDVHLRAQWGIDGMKLYVDGVLVGSNTFKGRITRSGGALTMGSNFEGSRSMIGIIKDCRVISLEPGLIAYFPFNGNSDDESGHGNNCAPTNCTLAADRYGNPDKAYFFNGSTSVMNASVDSLFSVTHVTLSAWVKAYAYRSDNPRIIAVGPDGTVQQHYALIWHDTSTATIGRGRLDFYTVGSGLPEEIYSKTRLKEDSSNWHHLVVTFDSSRVSFYYDGVQDTVIEGSGSLHQFTSAILRIGNNYTDNDPFDGLLDEIRIYDRAVSATEVKGLYGDYRQQVRSICDVPTDQGGKLRVTWDRIYMDSRGSVPQIVSYGVWRRIPPGSAPMKASRIPYGILNDTLATLYDFVMSVNAVQSPQYNVVVPTLYDSSDAASNDETFLISAHTADPNVYYLSNPASGHSVDNIAPAPPSNLHASLPIEGVVTLTWDPNTTDRDFREYEIHRSTVGGFAPSSSTRIGAAGATTFTDSTSMSGYCYYYRLVSVDIHGNRSLPSNIDSASMTTSLAITASTGWNMVSLPLIVTDTRRQTLFPCAVGNVFKYTGSGYVLVDSLVHGIGYWVKLSCSPVTYIGYFRDLDTIPVNAGWNMIGGISFPVPVSSIGSDPGGIRVSNFFGFTSGYISVDSIKPGYAYWVKVSEPGKLIISAKGHGAPAAGRVTIVPTNELPPPPPGEIEANNSALPLEYELRQNYPNPFNPTTTITYSLKQSGHVKLTIFNLLGEVVAAPVNGEQPAGGHSVKFDAGGLPSGIYVYKIQVASSAPGAAGGFTAVRKMILIR